MNEAVVQIVYKYIVYKQTCSLLYLIFLDEVNLEHSTNLIKSNSTRK